MAVEFDLESMLSDILDDTKPLPTTVEVPTIMQLEPVMERTTETPATIEGGDLASALAAALNPEGPSLNTVLSVDTVAAQTDAFPVPQAVAPQPFADSAERTDGSYALPPVTMPKFTSEELASTLDLRNFATLATLNTSRWHAKVKDRQASRDAAQASNADEAAFETRKLLLAGADKELKRIHKAVDSARAKYYEMTLPWTTTGITDTGRRSGARMLPNTAFFDFITEMGKCKAEMTAALEAFVPIYPQLVQEARKMLGGRFDATEYPNADSIRNHFDLSFDFHPIPIGSDFKGLPDRQVEALALAIEGKTQVMLENAMQELWQRLYEAVGRMWERLSHPDKMFHTTLLTNVTTVARQLKHLNVTGDARIEDLRQYIEKHLCNLGLEDLKDKPVFRAEVAGHAQEVLQRMARHATT